MARFTTTGGSGEGTPGAPGADGADGQDGAQGEIGFPGFKYDTRRVFANQYVVGEIVEYDGDYFICIANNDAVTPAVGDYWVSYSFVGPQGEPGEQGEQGSAGLVYLGNYVSGNGYTANLAVVKGSDNNLYIATSSGGLGDPVGNSAEWDIFLPSGSGGTANIADFVFTNVDETNSSITVTGNKELTIQSGASEDLNVRAGDDLWLTADDNITVQADDELNLRSQDSTSIITNYVDLENAEHEWLFGSQGYLTLPGGAQIVSQPNSSGDGSGFSTLELVPDGTLETNQFLIIDPTAPNHIHIRAGGEQDASAADLFIGGERNHVRVSDGGRSVSISSKPATVINTYTNDNPISNAYFITSNSANVYVGDTLFYPGGDIVTIDSITQDSPSAGLITITANLNGATASFVAGQAHVFSHEESWNNYWQFGADGVLAGPAMGGLRVHGIEGYSESGNPLWVYSSDSVVINGGSDGEYLNEVSPENQIATVGDVTTAVGVGGNGEVTRWSPNFEATGLAFTGTGATYPTYNSHYVKNGRSVTFFIEIDMATVTNFGTGQYKTVLPYAPLAGTMHHFQSWCLVDETANPDNTGHAILQADHLANTSVLDLHYIKQSGGANSPVMEALFKQDSPVTLTTATHVYINGTYITAE